MTFGPASQAHRGRWSPSGSAAWLPGSWRALWLRGLDARSGNAFAFSVACVALATGVHALIGLLQPDTLVFSPYYAATLLATLVGGSEAGIGAMVLGGAVAYWLFAPPNWQVTQLALDLVNWASYGTSSAVIVWAAASYRGLLRRLRDEEHKRQLLNRELAHRLRNALASIQTILNQSLAGEKELLGKTSARIAALAATNDLLVSSGWRTASLSDIVAGELRPYDPSRVAFQGCDVQCTAEAATMLALVIHELATNAAKYGALSVPDGHIDISWRRQDGRLVLHWVEQGDLQIASPAREGFGTKLLQSTVRAFHGTLETNFRASGLDCPITLVLPEPRPGEAGLTTSGGF